MEWKNYIVGLVDILGQSRKLDELGSLWWELQAIGNVTKEKSKKLTELTSETYEEVEYFREPFTKNFNNMKDCTLKNPRMTTLSPAERAEVTKIANDICTLRSFSDLVVFYAPFDTKDELLTRARIAFILCACVCVLILKSRTGTFLRGGIEIGAGAELSNGDLYGPVLNEAHRLEKVIADYPRIVIGRKLSTFIHCQAQTLDAGEYLNGVLGRVDGFCKNIICRDDDGEVIVDYLSKEAFKLNQFPGSKGCSFVQQGITRIEDSLKEHKEKGNQKLAKRYEKLLAYYQSRTKFWAN